MYIYTHRHTWAYNIHIHTYRWLQVYMLCTGRLIHFGGGRADNVRSTRLNRETTSILHQSYAISFPDIQPLNRKRVRLRFWGLRFQVENRQAVLQFSRLTNIVLWFMICSVTTRNWDVWAAPGQFLRFCKWLRAELLGRVCGFPDYSVLGSLRLAPEEASNMAHT